MLKPKPKKLVSFAWTKKSCILEEGRWGDEEGCEKERKLSLNLGIKTSFYYQHVTYGTGMTLEKWFQDIAYLFVIEFRNVILFRWRLLA